MVKFLNCASFLRFDWTGLEVTNMEELRGVRSLTTSKSASRGEGSVKMGWTIESSNLWNKKKSNHLGQLPSVKIKTNLQKQNRTI